MVEPCVHILYANAQDDGYQAAYALQKTQCINRYAQNILYTCYYHQETDNMLHLTTQSLKLCIQVPGMSNFISQMYTIPAVNSSITNSIMSPNE